ncbi:hypothetical protein BaRGS_00009175 [Batillaria attramentaria]|uniref:Uncharacterized protein n=1 Tax=Batillaria attramentaria TaxID=370345 RepID=A0ABD0LJC1_9CAEN
MTGRERDAGTKVDVKTPSLKNKERSSATTDSVGSQSVIMSGRYPQARQPRSVRHNSGVDKSDIVTGDRLTKALLYHGMPIMQAETDFYQPALR